MTGFHFMIRFRTWMLNDDGLFHYVETGNGKYKWHEWKKWKRVL